MSRATVREACEAIGAVRVGRGQYAYRDDAAREVYVSSGQDMLELARRLRRDPDAYSRWCGDTISRVATAAERAAWDAVVS
jgi:hypothetical protein